MTRDQDGLPVVGDRFAQLGVRPGHDIAADDEGRVLPATGGMSVQRSAADLPSPLIPKRYRGVLPDACGSNRLELYSHGFGEFIGGPIDGNLDVRIDAEKPTHGFVEPASAVLLEEFQRSLAATRSDWTVVQVGGGCE